MALNFNSSQVRRMGRDAMGVNAIKLKKRWWSCGCSLVDNNKNYLLLLKEAMEKGWI